MAEMTAAEIADAISMQNSLNSVGTTLSMSDPDTNGITSYDRTFFGNDLPFAHTTEEVNLKCHTTQPELSDQDIYFPYRAELKAVIAKAEEALEAVDSSKKADLETAIAKAKAIYFGDAVEAKSTVSDAITALESAIATAQATEEASEEEPEA